MVDLPFNPVNIKDGDSYADLMMCFKSFYEAEMWIVVFRSSMKEDTSHANKSFRQHSCQAQPIMLHGGQY